jgi:hypothetical protein
LPLSHSSNLSVCQHYTRVQQAVSAEMYMLRVLASQCLMETSKSSAERSAFSSPLILRSSTLMQREQHQCCVKV